MTTPILLILLAIIIPVALSIRHAYRTGYNDGASAQAVGETLAAMQPLEDRKPNKERL